MEPIPVIDIAPLIEATSSEQEVSYIAEQMARACQEVGFFYVLNHGVEERHLEALLTCTRVFFTQEHEDKMKIHMKHSKLYRGFTPLGDELTNGKRDWNEAVDFGQELPFDHPDVRNGMPLQGVNLWPDYPANFKSCFLEHWDIMLALGTKITEGLALSLGLKRGYFDQFLKKSQSTMRILHYPPRPGQGVKNLGGGIGEHVDYGFLTMLLQDDTGGLEIQRSDGTWIDAPHIPGSFIINIGHMMERWTNDKYKATPHRAKIQSERHRYSIPFFFEPDFDTIVTPLENCCSNENPSRYAPLHFGEYILSKFRQSYVNNMS